MPRYLWNEELKEMVKISDKVPRHTSGHIVDRPLREQVLDGYKRLEARGERTYGTPAGIKRIWSA